MSTERTLTIYLPTLVFLDTIGVTLVIPLLQQYYRDAGVVHATQRELLNSVYSSSQIVGGLTIGALNDAGLLSPLQTLTYLSFLGSAVSYALLGYSLHVTTTSKSLFLLISSRVLVGFVKQTVTVTTTMVSKLTLAQHRSKYLGKLSVARTLAGIIGPSLGAYLYQHVGRSAPVLLASFLFIVNVILANILLPRTKLVHTAHISANDRITDSSRLVHISTKPWMDKLHSFIQYTKNSCFQSKDLSGVILSTLLYYFISGATSYANMSSYYEERYGIMPYQRGYLSSYQSLWTLFVQTFVIYPLLIELGGEATAACIAAGMMTILTFVELKSSLTFFLIFICPILATSTSLLSLTLRTLLTHVSPVESLSSTLAALDVLTNAASVLVPFYRTLLFRLLGCFNGYDDSDTCLKGDPTPSMWLRSSALHWLCTTIIMYTLLLRSRVAKKSKI